MKKSSTLRCVPTLKGYRLEHAYRRAFRQAKLKIHLKREAVVINPERFRNLVKRCQSLHRRHRMNPWMTDVLGAVVTAFEDAFERRRKFKVRSRIPLTLPMVRRYWTRFDPENVPKDRKILLGIRALQKRGLVICVERN